MIFVLISSSTFCDTPYNNWSGIWMSWRNIPLPTRQASYTILPVKTSLNVKLHDGGGGGGGGQSKQEVSVKSSIGILSLETIEAMHFNCVVHHNMDEMPQCDVGIGSKVTGSHGTSHRTLNIKVITKNMHTQKHKSSRCVCW